MTELTVKLDHLIVAAETLDVGVQWVHERLGVIVPHGGAHDHMATHNCVGCLSGDVYLEIIAINPDETPDRVRWFSMDEPSFRARLKREPAFLHHWAVNTSDLGQSIAGARHDAGAAMAMSRGDMRWNICVRDDGVLVRDGIVPTIIEWPDGAHPSRKMVDLGLEFQRLEVRSIDPDAVKRDLKAIGADPFCDVMSGSEDRLSAVFERDGVTVSL